MISTEIRQVIMINRSVNDQIVEYTLQGEAEKEDMVLKNKVSCSSGLALRQAVKKVL